MGAHGEIEFHCPACNALNEVQQNFNVKTYKTNEPIPSHICSEKDEETVYCDRCGKKIVLQKYVYHTLRAGIFN